MRVLVWSPQVNPGGGGRMLLQLARALARHPEVERLTLAAPAPALTDDQRVALDEASVALLDLATAGPAWSRWLRTDGRARGIRGTGRVKAAARSALRRGGVDVAAEWQDAVLGDAAGDYDVVYAFWPHAWPCPRVGLPVVCTYHDTTVVEYPEMLGVEGTKAEFARSEGWLRDASQVVVSSQSTRADLVRVFGEPGLSAVVVPAAVAPTAEAPIGDARSDAVARLPARYVVVPACLAIHKNHAALLVAWSRFSQRQEVPLVLFGSGTHLLNEEWPTKSFYLGLVGLMRRLGLVVGKDLIALGYVDDADVPGLIAGADALVMPTLAEAGGSFPVEEAISLGVPVLCSDIPVLREPLTGRDVEVGWFDPFSADSILAALDDLFADLGPRKAAAMRARGEGRNGWDDVAADYVTVFRAVLDRGGHGPSTG